MLLTRPEQGEGPTRQSRAAPEDSCRTGNGRVGWFMAYQTEENTMKSGTKDKVEGAFHQAKGKVKEVAGKITGQADLEIAGTDEKVAGKIQEKVGEIKTVLGK